MQASLSNLVAAYVDIPCKGPYLLALFHALTLATTTKQAKGITLLFTAARDTVAPIACFERNGVISCV